jgi:peptide/nickel transport system substrate-binding protein
MMKKIVWVFVSCLMVLSLVIASCGTKEEEGKVKEEEGGQVVITEEGKKVEGEVAKEKAVLPPEMPKYGGTYTYIGGDVNGFDPAVYRTMDCTANHFVNGYAMMGDWTLGPAGSNIIDWNNGFAGRSDVWAGNFAESWEIPDSNTIIFHVRKGIHFQNKYPVNGREMTADDFAYSWNRAWFTPGAYHPTAVDQDAIPTSIKALDKYTLEIKLPAKQIGVIWLLTGAMAWIYPHEIIDTYGNMNDWRNLVGAGPFSLTDYVPAASLTYEKNPTYWEYDPYHPENQLPYIDEVKCLIIPDLSTQLAAFRTGKVDKMAAISWENGELLKKQCPNLQDVVKYGMPNFPWMRVDKPDIPLYDIRVRQAMNMAVNKQEIVDQYYGGHATMMGWPYLPTASYAYWYIPLEDQPEDVQELFTYNPEKAKQLLTDAGYPNGFHTTIVCQASDADYLSMIREYLLKVGVDMEIQQLEASIYLGMVRARTHDAMILKFGTQHWPARFLEVRKESLDCASYFESPTTREWYNTMMANYWKPEVIDPILKQYGTFVLEQALAIWVPVPETYIMWWPWVQNYHGENVMGFTQVEFFTRYIWLDKALKNSMGY